MKVALVCSNNIAINMATRKGTEIFNHILVNGLSKVAAKNNLNITVFASGDSDLPVDIESVAPQAISSDKTLPEGKHIIFELALISKAFSMQDNFDLFHINIGDGDIAVPFSPFVKKPILITLHNISNAKYTNEYFALFKKNSNVFFISASDAQRKVLPDLNYLRTIHHGIDTSKFIFNKTGGESIMWAGRARPKKGIDAVVKIAIMAKRKARLFGISNKKYEVWLKENVVDKVKNEGMSEQITFEVGLNRYELMNSFQTSKLFLFPSLYEEAFGFVLIESMSCGTPVVAYARGSIPEVIVDGVTGFIVNQSSDDIRGEWIIKKIGIEGLQEAVEKIYDMPGEQYRKMRKACREHVEQNFTTDVMTQSYIQAYREALSNSY